jgi:HlyD family secretion protein
MKKSKIGTFVFIAILLALAGVVTKRAFSGPQTIPNAKDEIKAERALKPATGTDEKTVVPEGVYIAGNGIVEPADRETKVSAHLAGRIQTILVKEGDFVELGAPLAELDNTAEKAGLAAAEGDIAAARADTYRTAQGRRREDIDAVVADTESSRARSELSASTLKRTQDLAKGGAASADELDRVGKQAEVDSKNYAAAEARKKAALAGGWGGDVSVAQARVIAAIARRDQAKAQLERLTIRAPIAGQVLQVKARAGEFFNPQGQEPLVVMGDTRKLRVRMDVDERDMARVKVGAAAFATLSAFPGQRFSGKVSEVGKRMGRKNVRTDDPTERIDTKILEVVFDLEAPKGLVPGLRVTSYLTPQ